jgi:Flp pilus assembly protein TadG
MKVPFGARYRRDSQTAQTLVFFLLAWGTIMLLCGLAIDSGLLYLAKARLGRAVDGAALAAVGNFNRSSNPVTNRDDVATIMRNFAVANFEDLGSISTNGGPSGGTPVQTTSSNGQAQTSYTYNFNDGTQDANGQYRRFVQVILNIGSSGNITSATCNARCPVQTYFIGYATYAINGRQNVKIGGYSGPSSLVDLKVSSSAVATRNPRLIMVVIDRSASMLQPGGGASGLPPAVVQFLDFFSTSSDYIGIVSFGSSARLEMPLTTNFLVAGTNDLIDAYNVVTNNPNYGVPGLDPEIGTDPTYSTNGVRRLKFGGQTAADEGIRLAMETMMANSGFNDPDVVKYMVIFTDGAWNASRTLVAAPPYTNWMLPGPAANATNVYLSPPGVASFINGQVPGYWSTTLANDSNLAVMPSMVYNTNQCNIQGLLTALSITNQGPYQSSFTPIANALSNQMFQSVDSSGYEPLYNPTTTPTEGAPMSVTNTPLLYSANGTNYYTRYVDVWLQPGAVLVASGAAGNNYFSDAGNPSKHVGIYLDGYYNTSLQLIVPGYILDGILYDGLDMGYASPNDPNYPFYRLNNFHEAFMWPDDTDSITSQFGYAANSLEMQEMFRNYPNLLTGYYVFRPDEPLSSATEPLDDTTPATHRPLYGLGPYYPSAGFYWPFDLAGVDYDLTYGLANPPSNPDPDSGASIYNQSYAGGARHIAYSINMHSTNAAPEWAGELFYKSISGGGTNVYSGNGTTSASQVMVASDWMNGAPSWFSDFTTAAPTPDMTNEPTHDTNITPNPSVFRPSSFLGTPNFTGDPTGAGVYLNGTLYLDSMCYSGRPTHYFDVTKSKWVPIPNNHVSDSNILQIGNWKAREYAWHARALGVTVYTVGYGSLVSDAEQAFLAQIANATNTTAGGGTSITYNPNQPIGEQFYATNESQISNDFYSVGQAINEALTGGQ